MGPWGRGRWGAGAGVEAAARGGNAPVASQSKGRNQRGRGNWWKAHARAQRSLGSEQTRVLDVEVKECEKVSKEKGVEERVCGGVSVAAQHSFIGGAAMRGCLWPSKLGRHRGALDCCTLAFPQQVHALPGSCSCCQGAVGLKGGQALRMVRWECGAVEWRARGGGGGMRGPGRRGGAAEAAPVASSPPSSLLLLLAPLCRRLLLPLQHRLQLPLHRLKACHHLVASWQPQLAAQVKALLDCRGVGTRE